MNSEDIKVKKDFIIAFFDEFEGKISNLYKMISQSYLEEALILACCYIGGLASLRYGLSNDRENFIKIIYDYLFRCYLIINRYILNLLTFVSLFLLLL